MDIKLPAILIRIPSKSKLFSNIWLFTTLLFLGTCYQAISQNVHSITASNATKGTSDCNIVDFNEDFGQGVGRVCIDPATATTTYTCNTIDMVDDGEYVITNNSNGLNSGWHANMTDHTGNTDGRAFFVNADFSTGEFYRRTISLDPETAYSFGAWITTVYDTDTGICGGTGIPSNVTFRIEDPSGSMIAETNTGDIPNGPEPNWQQFFISFDTGSNSDIQLVLINNGAGGCGNDLAIDDITLGIVTTEPVIATPPNLTACDTDGNGTELFDLTVQTAIVLDGQDPTQFNVSFHNSLEDAQLDQMAIADPTNYNNTSTPETIFVRVERVMNETCFSTVNFNISADPPVVLTTNLPDELNACSSDVIPTLDATPTNPGIDPSQVTYEWVNGNGTVVSTQATFTPIESDTYTVTLNLDPCGQGTDTVVVDITEAPVLDLGPDQALCDVDGYEIVPIIEGDTMSITYLWSTGETTPTIVVQQTGTYSVTISVGNCMVSDSITIGTGEPIEVSVGDDFKTCPNEPQILSATASNPDATYQWFLNGELITGATNASLEITLEANVMGTQTYTVVASDGDCSGEAEIDVTLYDIGNCTISQGISPNSDGFNDILNLEFLADRSGISQLQIFNRLGTLVYDKSNYRNEWKGQTTDNEELPTGTYFYVLTLEADDPVFGTQPTGWIYLNRDAN
jgi:gliding motility-associated-like protein|tara:strand:- start:21054 stop:23108 length:2055 start_codon:yes stop_codon:yes gene_type:complete